jgi:hypothetical protein
VLEGLEKDAREAKKGLWVDPVPIPPWVYRKARRGQSPDLSDLVPLDAETEGSASFRGPPLVGAIDQDSPTSAPCPTLARWVSRPHTHGEPVPDTFLFPRLS